LKSVSCSRQPFEIWTGNALSTMGLMKNNREGTTAQCFAKSALDHNDGGISYKYIFRSKLGPRLFNKSAAGHLCHVNWSKRVESNSLHFLTIAPIFYQLPYPPVHATLRRGKNDDRLGFYFFALIHLTSYLICLYLASWLASN